MVKVFTCNHKATEVFTSNKVLQLNNSPSKLLLPRNLHLRQTETLDEMHAAYHHVRSAIHTNVPSDGTVRILVPPTLKNDDGSSLKK